MIWAIKKVMLLANFRIAVKLLSGWEVTFKLSFNMLLLELQVCYITEGLILIDEEPR